MTRHPTDLSAVWDDNPPPTFEHALVRDAMHPGLVECSPEMNMQTVARIMAHYRVHAVVVTTAGPDRSIRPWGVVTDVDVMAAAPDALDRRAGDCMRTDLVTVAPGDPLSYAGQLMAEHGVTHVVVADSEHDRPLGVVSTLDVARTVGYGLL
jgi:CBS domain-containing protein